MQEAVLVATRADARRRIAGVPLAKRAIIVLARAGVGRIVVIADRALAAELASDAELAALAAERVIVGTFAEARAHVTGRVVLVGAETVFDVGLVKTAAAAGNGAPLARCVDRQGRPTGVYVASTTALDATSMDDVIARHEAAPIDIGDALWHDASTDEALAQAEDALFRSLGKRTDGPVSRLINRPISTFVTRRLVTTNVTPNQMTIVANVIGALGVILVFRGTWGMVALGSFLVQMQSILDGCDGEIARLKFKSSKIGEWLDNVLDDQVNVGYGVALGYAGSAMTGQAWWTWVGVAAGAAFMVHNLIFYYQLAFIHRSGNPFNFRWWFEKPGVDVTAMLDRDTLVTRVGGLARSLIRRDVFLLGFCLLACAGLPHVAAAWYAAIAASQFGLMMVHVANGGPPKPAS